MLLFSSIFWFRFSHLQIRVQKYGKKRLVLQKGRILCNFKESDFDSGAARFLFVLLHSQ